jgi:uncharacterized membrane protein YjjP (DUF1212 family)
LTKEIIMSVDGTDLSKITGDSMKVMAEAAVAAAAPAVVKKGGWFISHVAAIALSVIMPLVGFLIGRGVERSAVAAVEAVGGGSGSGSALGSAAAPEVRTVPYDAKSVAAEAIVGPLSGSGEVAHPAHPADAATAAETDAK